MKTTIKSEIKKISITGVAVYGSPVLGGGPFRGLSGMKSQMINRATINESRLSVR